jgi:hypothetical protein
MSGIEIVLGRTALSGASKIAGIGLPAIAREYSRTRTIGSLRDESPVGNIVIEGNPTHETATAIKAIFNSSEIDGYAISLASALFLKECGSDPSDRVRDLRNQFCIAARLRGGGADCNAFAGRAFDALSDAVLQQVSRISQLNDGHLPDVVKGIVIKSAAHHAAAMSRNSKLLQAIESIADIDTFKQQLRLQVASLNRTMRLPHAGTSRQVPYAELFVPPVLNRGEATPLTIEEPLTLREHCGAALRLIILGNPGGGKTTLVLKETYSVAAAEGHDGDIVPFLIVLREYLPHYVREKMSIVEYIETICETPYGVKPPPGAIEYLLLNGQALVIFDGLDELLDTSQRRGIVSTVEGFAYRYPTTQIVVTSRKIGYDEAPLDAELFAVARLDDFDDGQVELYARNWFRLDDSNPIDQRDDLADSFLEDSQYVHDLRVNPLLLSLMCGIYASEHYIPRNRPDVYEKCALLLFDRWDKQRGIDAPLAFDAHVQGAMRALALWLYPQQESQTGMPRDTLVKFMAEYLQDKRFDNEEEATNAAVSFIDFCKGRAWVLTDLGAELYGFTHRTFLEYFAASQLVRLAPSADGLLKALQERVVRKEWDVVAQLAVQILGKSVEDGADDFLELLVTMARKRGLGANRDSLQAASFAARTLAFIVPRPPVLRQIVELAIEVSALGLPSTEELDYRRRGTEASNPLSEVLCANLENLPLIDKYFQEIVVPKLEDDIDARPHLLKTMWHTGSFAHTVYPTRVQNDWWTSTELPRRSRVVPLMIRRAPFDAWAATQLWEFGEVSLAEVLEHHDVDCLFELFQLDELLRLLPSSTNLMLFAQQDDGTGSSNSLRGFTEERKPEVLRETNVELLARRHPWVKFRESDMSQRSLSRWIFERELDLLPEGVPTNRDYRGVSFLLKLPYAEARGKDFGNEAALNDVVAQLAIMRFRGRTGRRLREHLGKMDVEPEVEDFLSGWAQRQFSLVERESDADTKSDAKLAPRREFSPPSSPS